MKIHIIHPSRGRAKWAMETARKWHDLSKNPKEIEYRLAIDYSDPSGYLYDDIVQSDTLGLFGRVKVVKSGSTSCVEAINNAASVIKSTNSTAQENALIVVVSDDFDCFEHWDEWLIQSLRGKKDVLVKTSDGYYQSDWLITLPIMDMVYYNRFNYVYNPEYRHMWADTEMTAVGHMLGRVVDLQNNVPVFRHNHYTTGKSQKDLINEIADSSFTTGRDIFLRRHAIDFGLAPEDVVVRFPREKFTT